jgi:hypothetical protein
MTITYIHMCAMHDRTMVLNVSLQAIRADAACIANLIVLIDKPCKLRTHVLMFLYMFKINLVRS